MKSKNQQPAGQFPITAPDYRRLLTTAARLLARSPAVAPHSASDLVHKAWIRAANRQCNDTAAARKLIERMMLNVLCESTSARCAPPRHAATLHVQHLHPHMERH